MRVLAILAVDSRGGIGIENRLPWPKIKEDRAHFQRETMGKGLVMGRRTWESLGRALPGRHIVVLTNADIVVPSGVAIARDVRQAMDIAGVWGEEIVVAGGAAVFESFRPFVTAVSATIIHERFDCDTFVPMKDGFPDLVREGRDAQLSWRNDIESKEQDLRMTFETRYYR